MAERILVTGGAGLIGSRLVKSLYDGERQIFILDNLSTGDLKRIEYMLDDPLVTFYNGDLGRFDLQYMAKAAIQRFDPDLVYHLAAPVGVDVILNGPKQAILNPIDEIHDLLLTLDEHIPIVFTSTSEVYGKNPHSPLDEEDTCYVGPPNIARWSYAIGKMAVESLLHASGRRYLILRLFNTVGPSQKPETGMVIPKWVDKALSGEPIEIHGDGQQIRCFSHVEDVVEWMRFLVENPRTKWREVYNIGSHRNLTTIAELAHRVVETLRKRGCSTPEIEYVSWEDRPRDDVMSIRSPSLTKTREYVPNVGEGKLLHEIIEEIVDFQKWRRDES